MKFIVTYVRQSRHSRRRVGKASTEVIDTERMVGPGVNSVFNHLTKPEEIEAAYEGLYATDPTVTCKVVDVRMVIPNPPATRCATFVRPSLDDAKYYAGMCARCGRLEDEHAQSLTPSQEASRG